MPTYDYRCLNKKCAAEFEDIHPIAAPSPACVKCGGPCKRLVTWGGGGHLGDTPKFYPNRR